jgi:Calcineurin-like phosphoesterase
MRSFVRFLVAMLIAGVAYLATSVGLSYFGVIDEVPLGFGFKFETPKRVSTAIEASPEAPIALVRGESVHVYRILATKSSRAVIVDSQSFHSATEASIEVSPVGKRPFRVPLRTTFQTPPAEYAAATALVALSDIEGEFDALVALLTSAGVIDSNYNWIFGTGHVAILGDTMDRGSAVFECLWLLFKLEGDAAIAGGQLHMLLGNHEQKNFFGARNARSLKDVADKYFVNATLLGVEYVDWIGTEAILGRWLRSRNAIERIGDRLFMHGGVSPALVRSGLSITALNERVRETLDSSIERWSALDSLIAEKDGPLWYRGLAQQSAAADHVTAMLAAYRATEIVIAHTILDPLHITSLYDGRVLAIDTHHAGNWKRRIATGARWRDGRAVEFDTNRGERAPRVQ